MSFAELGLCPELLRALADEGYEKPTPIQAQAIPVVVSGRDLLGAAQTGTGKTAAFTLPILNRLASQPREVATTARAAPPKVLVLVPTRELAAQVGDSVRTYGRHLPAIKTAIIFGGVGINPQIDQLRRGVDILVATPGRLLDHLQQRTVNLSGIQMLVLDEADRMLDMGFIRDIRRVIQALPAKRQNLLFSATFNPEIRGLAEGLLHDPASVDVAPRNTAAETVAQRVHPVDKGRKTALIAACGSPRLLEMHAMLYDQAYRYRRVMMTCFKLPATLDDEHQELVDLVLQRQVEPACRKLAEHLASTILIVYPSGGDLADANKYKAINPEETTTHEKPDEGPRRRRAGGRRRV